MVEETIQMIRETEAQANAMIKDAEAKCADMLSAASKEAVRFKEEQLAKMKQQAAAAMENARQEGEKVQKGALSDIEQEVKSLKEAALAKEEEAVSHVISQLI